MPKNSVVLETQVHAATETHEVAKENVDVNFSMRNLSSSQIALSDSQKEQIVNVLSTLPAEHADTVERIILDYNASAGRGLGGNNTIILRGVNMSVEEFISVLVHETGHNVDYAYLTESNKKQASEFKDGSATLYITDPSVDFFRISWEDESTFKKTANNLDFVSGYAMSDPFEDFAETYVYYVLHNKDFKALTASSPNLYAKYRFMKYRVFDGVEFDTGDGIVNEINRPWDITVLDYELTDFLS
ncbi:hypothetical protein KKA95_04665 [Patescibacteria group bacterium]|nr:hypothetical protein [Patescibacteria group bacterium]